MKLLKKNLIYLSFLMVFITYSQTAFKKGYFVNNSGKKTECYIEKNNWFRLPLKIKFKTTLEGESKNITLNKINEFGIYNETRYVKRQVEIGKSSNNLNKLDDRKNLTFNKEQLFLKVIVEGPSSLYLYQNNNFKIYFFDTQTSEIKQLIYKEYLKKDDELAKNTSFRRQLFDNLKCKNINLKEIKGVKYVQKDLENIFLKYNKCLNANYSNSLKTKKPISLNLNIRPGVNFSSLEIQNTLSTEIVNFGNMTGIRFGVELEVVLPIKNNNWSVIFEPTFQSYKAETISGGELSPNLPKETKVDYKSLEMQLGIRHNVNLNKKSILFFNAGLILDLPLNSSIEFEKLNDFDRTTDINLLAVVNTGFGFGYKYNNKYSIEYRYQTNRNNFRGVWKSEYSSSALIFGLTIFRNN